MVPALQKCTNSDAGTIKFHHHGTTSQEEKPSFSYLAEVSKVPKNYLGSSKCSFCSHEPKVQKFLKRFLQKTTNRRFRIFQWHSNEVVPFATHNHKKYSVQSCMFSTFSVTQIIENVRTLV